MKKFALLGAAGYVAPRHMKAIKEVGGELIAAMDPHDSVGVLDAYFPKCSFFTEFERFDRYLEKQKRNSNKVDYLVICSPNYLHDAHIRYGLRYGADVICEKPLVLNPWNIDAISQFEHDSESQVNCILQLRHHPGLLRLKEKIKNSSILNQVDLKYISPRGNWYKSSWKGNEEKSGGLLTNIGVHLFDILIWIFGEVNNYTITSMSNDFVSGTLMLQKAFVTWTLSTDGLQSPNQDTPYRVMTVDGEDVNFSEGMEDLHVQSYQSILNNKGWTVDDCHQAIELIFKLKNINN